jgi:hypothetical protein
MPNLFSDHLPPPLVLLFAFSAFLTVKLVGYAAACAVLKKAFPDNNVGAWKAGAMRVALGVAGGLMYVALWSLIPIPDAGEHSWIPMLFHLGLFGTRVGAWWVLFALSFPGAMRERKRAWVCSFVGALWSHALDLPAWIALGLTFGWLIWW